MSEIKTVEGVRVRHVQSRLHSGREWLDSEGGGASRDVGENGVRKRLLLMRASRTNGSRMVVRERETKNPTAMAVVVALGEGCFFCSCRSHALADSQSLAPHCVHVRHLQEEEEDQRKRNKREGGLSEVSDTHSQSCPETRSDNDDLLALCQQHHHSLNQFARAQNQVETSNEEKHPGAPEPLAFTYSAQRSSFVPTANTCFIPAAGSAASRLPFQSTPLLTHHSQRRFKPSTRVSTIRASSALLMDPIASTPVESKASNLFVPPVSIPSVNIKKEKRSTPISSAVFKLSSLSSVSRSSSSKSSIWAKAVSLPPRPPTPKTVPITSASSLLVSSESPPAITHLLPHFERPAIDPPKRRRVVIGSLSSGIAPRFKITSPATTPRAKRTASPPVFASAARILPFQRRQTPLCMVESASPSLAPATRELPEGHEEAKSSWHVMGEMGETREPRDAVGETREIGHEEDTMRPRLTPLSAASFSFAKQPELIAGSDSERPAMRADAFRFALAATGTRDRVEEEEEGDQDAMALAGKFTDDTEWRDVGEDDEGGEEFLRLAIAGISFT
ncbi:hypothetical protein BC830DRAFT_1171047 [Chytriomyces sp. MP71]|nr:hypothetical protein BC830DRAFT_1171047 [Chytriomyces sp. MP71]